MSKESFRQETAVKMLQGLLSNPEIDTEEISEVVSVALEYTDELIRQLDNNEINIE